MKRYLWKEELYAEIMHLEKLIVLRVEDASILDTLRAKMVEINQNCTFPNQETVEKSSGKVVFVVTLTGNVDYTWGHFVALLNELAGIEAELQRIQEELVNEEEWLTLLAKEAGYFVVCLDCGEEYWSEDGHPTGTLCPKYGGEETPAREALPGDKGFFLCTNHQKWYWYEDDCPVCREES